MDVLAIVSAAKRVSIPDAPVQRFKSENLFRASVIGRTTFRPCLVPLKIPKKIQRYSNFERLTTN